MKYKLKRADRAAGPKREVGQVVDIVGDHYGLARDDTEATGVAHVCVCDNPSGQPFFTVPFEDLERVILN